MVFVSVVLKTMSFKATVSRPIAYKCRKPHGLGDPNITCIGYNYELIIQKRFLEKEATKYWQTLTTNNISQR